MKGILSCLAYCGSIVAVAVGINAGINLYSHHNVVYETRHGKVFQKADGLFAHTTLEFLKDGSIELTRYSVLGSSGGYTDKDGDEKVDKIYISPNFKRGSHFDAFYRDKDFQKNPEIFQDADRDFREQKRRFQPLISRK